MENSTHLPHSPLRLPAVEGHFNAVVNARQFLTTHLSAVWCLRPELDGVRTHSIWKVHAVGQVASRRTVFGLFIDRMLKPGTYDLVANDRLTVVYHLTPRRIAQVYHSRDFQQGSLTLLACEIETGRLKGTFEFAIPAIGFEVTDGQFELICGPVPRTGPLPG